MTKLKIVPMTKLKINLNRCKIAQDLLSQTELKYGAGISLISEPYMVKDDTTWMASKNGCAAIHQNTSKMTEIGTFKRSGRHTVMIQWMDVSIVSCYISPNVDDKIFEEFLDELDECIQDADGNIVIDSDFNAKAVLWGCRYTNSRGDRLNRWCADRDLILMNKGNVATCVRHQGSSIIDLVWCNVEIASRILNWRVLDEETYSDHRYVVFEIEKEEIGKERGYLQIKRKKYQRWAYKRLDIDKFSEAIEWSCVGNNLISDVPKATKWLKKVLTKACDYAMPRAKNLIRTSVYWWFTDIQTRRKDCRKARRNWQKTKARGRDFEIILEKEEIYRSKRKELGNTIKKAKQRAWNELISSIEKDPWGLPYRIMLGKLRRSSPSLTETLDSEVLVVIDKLFPEDDENFEDTRVNTNNNKAKDMYKNSIKISNVNMYKSSVYIQDNDDEMDHQNPWRNEYSVSTEELYSILRKTGSNNKASGIDGFKSTYIKRIPKILMDRIRDVYNTCLKDGIFPKAWKKAILILISKGELDVSKPKVRPICLLNELGKLLERVINSRIHEWMTNNSASRLSKNQFGFHRNMSTHRCFYSYLCRIGKIDSAICPFCKEEEDTAEHTLQKCIEWEAERELLTSEIGEDLTLSIVIDKILDCEENWLAFCNFAETVMSRKEEDEKVRKHQIDNPRSST